MGSSTSRLGSRLPGSRPNRKKLSLSSFICGGSSSHAPLEMEDHLAKSSMSSLENLAPVSAESQSSKESSSIFGSETGFTGSKTDNGASSESSNDTIQDAFGNYGLRNVERSSRGKCLSESSELDPQRVDANCTGMENCRDRNSDRASTSFKEQPSQESVSANSRGSLDAADKVDDSMDNGLPSICAEDIRSSSVPRGLGNLGSVGESAGMEFHNSDAGSVSDSLVTFQLVGDDSSQESTPPGPGFLVSDTVQDPRGESVLQVDVVSISSNILSSSIAELSNREARRNSRRLFWDAFSRRSLRRHSDSPTIIFATSHADDLGSHDRWLLDFSGDLHYDGVGRGFGYVSTRSHRRNERRWQSRSEISDRLRGGLDEGGRRTASCPSGLHPDGTCSCDSYLMAEEFSTRASISRVVMLAEALFEVLDEIHHHPASLSLSMLSLPAPESVVNSLPLKNYKKSDTTGTEAHDEQQCYICLCEYEEGDKIRILPCRHEYHMSCVDKWLKEIHGVCPLCRGDVCKGVTEGSVPESPSL
ncbi:hypothetical protein L1049_018183 [Liquidambar formosana]|uniref:RING-type domain-containing protein n=1 Tax=Liquidambar formosana TaxID=63359 RepID=A0AAP0R9P7_LIQFO